MELWVGQMQLAVLLRMLQQWHYCGIQYKIQSCKIMQEPIVYTSLPFSTQSIYRTLLLERVLFLGKRGIKIWLGGLIIHCWLRVLQESAFGKRAAQQVDLFWPVAFRHRGIIYSASHSYCNYIILTQKGYSLSYEMIVVKYCNIVCFQGSRQSVYNTTVSTMPIKNKSQLAASFQ